MARRCVAEDRGECRSFSFGVSLRGLGAMLPLLNPFISAISVPFATPYSQISSVVDRVIRSPENANNLFHCQPQGMLLRSAYRSAINSPYPLRRIQHLKDRVWVEVVELIASFNPEPIAKCYAPTQCESGEEGDGVGRGEEEEVEDEGGGWDGVEGKVGVEG